MKTTTDQSREAFEAPKLSLQDACDILVYAGEGRTNSVKPDLLANEINRRIYRAWQAAHQAATPAPEPQGVRLTQQIAEMLHLRLAAAQNLPYEDGDVCEECLVFAQELLALAASPATVAGARPKVEGAMPVCLDCNKAGLRNCSHFDNCDGTWVYKPDSRLITLLTGLRGLRELSEKATPGPWDGPCLHYDENGKRRLFPHIHIGKKEVHRRTESNSAWIPEEWEGECKNYLVVNNTSTGGDLQHFDDNAAFILACVNFVRAALDTLVRTMEGAK